MPAMPKADAPTMARFEALVPKRQDISLRPMFGHRAAFVQGHMFAGTFGADIVVRLDEADRRTLLAVDGARPFEPMKGRPMKEYVVLPRVWVTEGVEARAWIDRALAWTAQRPPKPRAPRRRPTGKARPGARPPAR